MQKNIGLNVHTVLCFIKKFFRKLVSGGFNFTIIKSFIPIFYEESMVLNKILQTKCNSSNECDISIPVSMATMEMIGKTAMGVTFNAQNGGHHRFIENLKTAMAVRNFFNPCYYFPGTI